MKILVSDYDGTFYTDDKNIRLNCMAIERFIKNGNLFVLSSGRSLKSLKEKVETYNIPYSYLSCCDGSFLYDNDGLMHCAEIVSHDVVGTYSELEKLNRHKKLEYTYPDDYYTKYNNIKLLASVAFTIDDANLDNKFYEVLKKIKRKHPEYQYDLYGYGGTTYLLIRPRGVSKSSPVEYLKSKYNLSNKDIFTIGDNTNDKELIKDYNGYRIGSNKDIIDVSLKEYKAVYELVNDIENKKVLKRW